MKPKSETNNPFDETKDKDKHEFFKQMTSAINTWMLTQYPLFDTILNEKILKLSKQQEDLSKYHSEIKMYSEQLKAGMEATKEKHLNFITGQVNEFLKKDYPDISNSLTLTAKELQKTAKKQDEYAEKTIKRLAAVVKSDSLYEDVYKMRDEFKEIQKFIDGFKKKIQKAFE
jgi:hypothetical protein